VSSDASGEVVITMRVITFKVDENLLLVLDKRAIQLGMSRSELLRHIIKSYLRTSNQMLIKTVVLE